MQFHSTFCPAKPGPVIHRHAEVNHAAIQTQQLVLKPEFLPPSHFPATFFQHLLKHRLVQLPRPMLIGVGQRRTLRALFHPKMPQLAFAGRQTPADLAQRLRTAQMTEQHGHHLGPTVKSTSVMLRPMMTNRLFKLGPRKYTQNLRKNTAYSTHGGKLLLIEIGFLENPNLNLAGFPPPSKNLIWTSLKLR